MLLTWADITRLKHRYLSTHFNTCGISRHFRFPVGSTHSLEPNFLAKENSIYSFLHKIYGKFHHFWQKSGFLTSLKSGFSTSWWRRDCPFSEFRKENSKFAHRMDEFLLLFYLDFSLVRLNSRVSFQALRARPFPLSWTPAKCAQKLDEIPSNLVSEILWTVFFACRFLRSSHLLYKKSEK